MQEPLGHGFPKLILDKFPVSQTRGTTSSSCGRANGQLKIGPVLVVSLPARCPRQVISFYWAYYSTCEVGRE